jgi:hypothetical protein
LDNPLPPPLECGIFDGGGEMELFTRPSSMGKHFFEIMFAGCQIYVNITKKISIVAQGTVQCKYLLRDL